MISTISLQVESKQLTMNKVNKYSGILAGVLAFFIFTGCESNHAEMKKIIFLHHSTGKNIWLGSTNRYINKLFNKSDVGDYFRNYNKANKTDYIINDRVFPKEVPYGWKNYPFDYYNIWVKHAGDKAYMGEPTLEMLTKEYDVIVFKHCYPASNILPDTGTPDIDSEVRTIENYKLQYNALKSKMHEFPKNKFIIWTPAANTRSQMTQDEAIRTREFYNWIINEWDEKGDNIYIWDFYKLETEGDLYMLDKNADSPSNSHPGKDFSARVSPLFSKFIIEVVTGFKE
jgi:hypothetical protein